MRDHNILVGTPAYNGQVHIDYVESLNSFHREGLNFEPCLLANESLITRARNEILRRFVEQEQRTHLLFLDGDVRLYGADLKRLIGHGKDVIGARVPLKTVTDEGGRIYNTGNELARVGSLSMVTRVGTAVLMLSRKAVLDLVADCEAQQRVYRIYNHRHKLPQEGLRYDVFRVGARDGEYLSEDFWVCYALRELGYAIYVDPRITVRHNGMYRF